MSVEEADWNVIDGVYDDILSKIKNRAEVEEIIRERMATPAPPLKTVKPPVPDFHGAEMAEAYRKLFDPYGEDINATQEDIKVAQEVIFQQAAAASANADPLVREDAAKIVKGYVQHAAVNIDPKRAGQALALIERLLVDPAPAVRMAFTHSLSYLQIDNIFDGGKAEDRPMRQDVEDRAFAALTRVLEDADPHVRKSAIETFYRFAVMGGGEEYLSKDPHLEVVMGVLDSVHGKEADVGVHRAVSEALAGIVMHEHDRVRARARYDRDYPGETAEARKARWAAGL